MARLVNLGAVDGGVHAPPKQARICARVVIMRLRDVLVLSDTPWLELKPTLHVAGGDSG